jgi:hypothetical protein
MIHLRIGTVHVNITGSVTRLGRGRLLELSVVAYASDCKAFPSDGYGDETLCIISP